MYSRGPALLSLSILYTGLVLVIMPSAALHWPALPLLSLSLFLWSLMASYNKSISMLSLNFLELYNLLLACLSKNSPFAGLIQVTKVDTVPALADFCYKRLNLREVTNIKMAEQMIEEIPYLWKIISGITNLEDTSFLPKPVR